MSQSTPFSPGDIYRTQATLKLVDGTTLNEYRALIIWESTEHLDRRDPRTNEAERTLLVTWATTDHNPHGSGMPDGDPFEITYYAHGWTLVEDDTISGQIQGHIGEYKPRCAKSNSTATMAQTYRDRVRQISQWRATRPPQPEPLWSAAMVANYLGVKPGTLRSYVADGKAPQPTRKVGGHNLWEPDAVRAWHSQRPGPGARTDLSTPSTTDHPGS